MIDPLNPYGHGHADPLFTGHRAIPTTSHEQIGASAHPSLSRTIDPLNPYRHGHTGPLFTGHRTIPAMSHEQIGASAHSRTIEPLNPYGHGHADPLFTGHRTVPAMSHEQIGASAHASMHHRSIPRTIDPLNHSGHGLANPVYAGHQIISTRINERIGALTHSSTHQQSVPRTTDPSNPDGHGLANTIHAGHQIISARSSDQIGASTRSSAHHQLLQHMTDPLNPYTQGQLERYPWTSIQVTTWNYFSVHGDSHNLLQPDLAHELLDRSGDELLLQSLYPRRQLQSGQAPAVTDLWRRQLPSSAEHRHVPTSHSTVSAASDDMSGSSHDMSGSSHARHDQTIELSSVQRSRPSKKSRTQLLSGGSRVSKRRDPSQVSSLSWNSTQSKTSPTSISYYPPIVQEIIGRAKIRYLCRTILQGPIFPGVDEKNEMADECFLLECKDRKYYGVSPPFSSPWLLNTPQTWQETAT